MVLGPKSRWRHHRSQLIDPRFAMALCPPPGSVHHHARRVRRPLATAGGCVAWGGWAVARAFPSVFLPRVELFPAGRFCWADATGDCCGAVLQARNWKPGKPGSLLPGKCVWYHDMLAVGQD